MNKMIIVIRISGQVGLRKDIIATLDRLRLKRKYACVVLNEKADTIGMIKKVKQYVAYGKIDAALLEELILKRGRAAGDKPVNPKNLSSAAVNDIISEKRKVADLGIKPFFRLHPPRGGFKLSTKQIYPKGVLGNWGDDINKLVKKML